MKNTMRNSQRTGVSTFASRTSPSTNQILQKIFYLSHADKIELKKSPPLLKKKICNRTTRQTMTLKLNTDNSVQRKTTEHQQVTAVWRNGGCSASYDSFVVGSSVVLRLNFCAKNPPLRQAANR
jgi:hypothetical protein